MSKNLDIQEFFLEGNDRKKSHVLLHITEPTTKEEKDKGYLFVLAEIDNGSSDQIRHLTKMIDDVESGFYETEEHIDEDSFEATLEYINRRSKKVLQDKENLHCIVANVKDGNISFAYHGKPEALLYFNEERGYKQMDLIEEKNMKKDQIFSSIIEGQIQTGDLFYLGTPNIKKVISKDRLKKTIANKNTQQAAQHIQTSLSGIKPDLSFGGILFQLQDKKQSQKEATTETNYRPRKKQKTKTVADKAVTSIGKTIWNLIKSLGRGLLKTGIVIKDMLVGLFILITNRGGQRKIVIRSMKKSFADKKKYIKELPLMSKLLFSTTILFALVFIGSLVFLRIQEAQQEKIQSYKNTVKAIQDKTESAEASIIYNNNKKAFSLLNEAKSKIDEIPQNIEEKHKIATKEELMNNIEKQFEKLRKVKKVEPKVLVDYTNQENKPNRLATIEDKLISYHSSSTKLNILDTNTKKEQTKEHTVIENLYQSATPKEQDYIVFNTGGNSVAQLNPESYSLSNQDISFPGESPKISGMFVYSRSLYTIDSNNGEVYKHSPTQTGFGKGSPWLNSGVSDNVDLTNANSIAIDGSIYVLKSDGNVLKFHTGNQQQFDIKGLDPELKNPTEIWTYTDLSYIYILEPSKQRIVVLDKEGNLVQQFKSDQWQNPSEMIVKENEDIIYVIDQGKLYSFELEIKE